MAEETAGRRRFPDDEGSAALFDALADELGGGDAIRPQQALMLADVVRYERLKAKLQADIEQRGLGGMERNGRQSYYKENKSVGMLTKLMDQQRRMMQALGLVKATKDQPTEPDDDGGFDDF